MTTTGLSGPNEMWKWVPELDDFGEELNLPDEEDSMMRWFKEERICKSEDVSWNKKEEEPLNLWFGLSKMMEAEKFLMLQIFRWCFKEADDTL